MKEQAIERNDIAVKLLKSRFFKYLTEEQLQHIISNSSLYEFENDDSIIKEGEHNSCFYVILDGAVNINVSQDNKKVYVATLGKGDIFGEAAIFLNVTSTADVISYEGVQVLKIERNLFLGFLKKYPAAGLKILMVIIYNLLKKLRTANKELAFERTIHSNINQDDIDSFIEEHFGD